MIKLTGIDETIDPILEERVTPELTATMPSYRRILRIVLGNTKAKNGEESVDIIGIGLKLKHAGDPEIDDSDFRLLKAKVNDNEMGMTAFLQGSMLIKMKDWEDQAMKARGKHENIAKLG